jgi:uncharacterized membrane protein SirB2
MLFIHVFFVFCSFTSFVTRVLLLEFKPELLQTKFLKISPHVIDTFLLTSGVSVVGRGDWIELGEYTWIISKFIVLLVYIGLGVLTMRSIGIKRWLSFTAALSCYGYILSVAVTKQGFI